MTASLHQAHARWMTDALVELRVSGLVDEWVAVRGSAIVPADVVRILGLTLANLAEVGLDEQDRELTECLGPRTESR